MELLNKYEKQIIEILIKHDKTLSEISVLIGISKPAASKHLKKLEEHNIIKGTYERNTIGRTIKYSLQPFQLLFSIDPSNKFIISFRADEPIDNHYIYLGYIQQKEFRREVKEYLDEIIKSSLEEYLIIIYGSIAQGFAHRKSDIDLLFLKENWSNNEKDEILNLIAIASNKCNHQAKPLFKTVKEFKEMDKTLQRQIKQKGIILYEKGKLWGRIKNQLIRYKIITI